ncbi:MAG: N-acetylmuramoyl-L-alanine amidase [Bdellovibrionales bacterium]|nr:N-acetylmuramoyl-L-alanine amidase [Bdellovibrionales bacterium]
MRRPLPMLILALGLAFLGLVLRLRYHDYRHPRPGPETFVKTQKVLAAAGLPEEADPAPFVHSFSHRQTLEGWLHTLQIIDPKKHLEALTITTPQNVTFFRDPYFKQQPDFSIDFASSESEVLANPTAFHRRLLTAAKNPRTLPLRGIKIALDPGHMGSPLWDERAERSTIDGKGGYLSEGQLALQTALLLEKRLTILGAQVMLTRRHLAPVTSLSWENIDLAAEARSALRDNSFTEDFRRFLNSLRFDAPLLPQIQSSDYLQSLQTEKRRWRYFGIQYDLAARAELIQTFAPDLTLIIHFDASDEARPPGTVNTNGYDATKGYIVGGAALEELATRNQRALLAARVMDPASWKASRHLTQAVVRSLHDTLRIPYDPLGKGTEDTVRLGDGVFARNLRLSSLLHSSAVSYLECLYQDDPQEFAQLLRPDFSMNIDGQPYAYSQRLVQVAQALEQGIIDFVRTYP